MSELVRALRAGRWLSGYAACVLAFMVVVILEGAVVRATGSGAGCGNHWPLCNGEVIPHHPRIATMIEFAHRSLTGILSTLVILLIVWVFVVREPGTRVRRAAKWVGVLLVTEALLGAVLVKGAYVEKNASDMRVFVQCIHFTNTMLLVAALTLTWWWARERVRVVAGVEARSVAWMSIVATLAVGATGSVAALADTLFPAPSLQAGLMEDFSRTAPLLVRMRWVHPAAALVGVVCVGWLCVRGRGTGKERVHRAERQRSEKHSVKNESAITEGRKQFHRGASCKATPGKKREFDKGRDASPFASHQSPR